MKKPTVSVFISYSHRDREDCERIAEILRRQKGVSVWYDEGLIPGDKYRRVIVEKLRDSAYFVLLLSEASTASEWVLDEASYAKDHHKKIVPIWLEETAISPEMEFIINRYHSLFWYARSSDEQFGESLLPLFGFGKQDKGSGQAVVGYGNEFSEAVNLEMIRLLKLERQGGYGECYTGDNACLLGTAYLFGGPCPIDRAKARHYFRIAEYQGCPDAAFYLLEMELEDRDQEIWDDAEAEFAAPILEKMKEMAKQGSIPAKLYLANIYWKGKYGWPVDMAKSAALYEECARKGNARAQYMMASNYYYGDAVPQDYDLAIMYANLAVEQKHQKSWRRWGKFYRDGLAVPRDYAKAERIFEKGAKMGDFNCYNKIGDMYYYGWGHAVNYDTAFRYYQKAEQAPVVGQKYALWKSKIALGRCYELGNGTERDLAMAAQKYLEGYNCGGKECREPYLRCSALLKSE